MKDLFGAEVPAEHFRWFTVNEVCGLLSVSRVTLYKMMKAGELKYSHVRSQRRISSTELKRYMNRDQAAEKGGTNAKR